MRPVLREVLIAFLVAAVIVA